MENRPGMGIKHKETMETDKKRAAVDEIAKRFTQELEEKAPKLKNGKPRKLSEEVYTNIYMRAIGYVDGRESALAERSIHGEDTAKEAGRKESMCQGVALAVAIYVRIRGRDSVIDEVWTACGMSLKECRDMGVDSYDMEILEQEYGDKDDDEYEEEQPGDL